MHQREQLRTMMIENAAEINRLHRRIHETVKRRSESEKRGLEWQQACNEFHRRYSELWIPGGSDTGFYERILEGDPATIEVALCFLEVRPYFFRSGYHWKTILQKCKRAHMDADQAERFARLLAKYAEWKKIRNASVNHGKAVWRDLWPLLNRVQDIFPIRLSNTQLGSVVTIKDLYNVVCNALKIQPPCREADLNGMISELRLATLAAETDMSERKYAAWRYGTWTPEDVWARLSAAVIEAYKLDPSRSVDPDTVVREKRDE